VCVPPAVLHTLIENALTHNVYPRGAVLRLTATREHDGRWRYTLRSPCPSTDASPTRGGSGQNYVRARLAEAFGDQARFSAARIDDDWIDTLIMPEQRACAW
jgi:LytS/YehU family sensor histidine kinase